MLVTDSPAEAVDAVLAAVTDRFGLLFTPAVRPSRILGEATPAPAGEERGAKPTAV
jgi:hypothetical protein